MSKRKITYRVNSDEMVLFGPIDRFEHMAMVYEKLAPEQPNRQEWLDFADWIRDEIVAAKRQAELRREDPW